MSIGYRDAEHYTGVFEYRQVLQIVAHRRIVAGWKAAGYELVHGSCFGFRALNNVLNAELLAASLYGGGIAAGNDRHRNAIVLQQLDAGAVLHMKLFQFAAVIRIDDPAVGKHAVDVEDDALDAACPVLQLLVIEHCQPGICACCTSSMLYPIQAASITMPSKRVMTGRE